MRPLPWLITALVLSTLSACGSEGAEPSVTSATPTATQYDGPLVLPEGQGRHPRAGAAGDVVDCTTWGTGGHYGPGIFQSGATADNPEKALVNARSEGGWSGVQTGLVPARREADRALYVVEVDGVLKQAVIVHDGPATKGAGGPGWHIESWATCDFSELPRSFTDSIGLQLWTDGSGSTVPTTKVQSYPGAEHCSWESMTFLNLGKDDYVRDPDPDLADYFAENFREHATVPTEARDTGFERDGHHLWIAADKSVAYVGAAVDAEVWPRTVRSLGCA